MLTKFKFVVENKTVPPGSMEENERIDPDIERNMYGIQERLVMIMDVCREIEGMTREEDEILSRISERKECLSEIQEKHEKVVRDRNSKIQEIDDFVRAAEMELEENESTSRVLGCNIQSARLSNNTILSEIAYLEQEIIGLQRKESGFQSEILNKENQIHYKLEGMGLTKEYIAKLIIECDQLHQISIADHENLSKLQEEIARFHNN